MSATVTDRIVPPEWEIHTLPDGTEVFYRDSDHSYYGAVTMKRDGKWSGVRDSRMAGVSTISGVYDWSPDGLMRHAAKQTMEGISQVMAMDPEGDNLSWLLTLDSIEERLRLEELRYTDRTKAAASRGTNVHKLGLEPLAAGEPMPRTDEMSEEERSYQRALIAFWHENEPESHASELIVCDRERRVSGRLDMIATLHAGRFKGRRPVIDAKTSASRFVPRKHHVQVAGYSHCAEACGYGETDGGLLLRLSPDGTYELVEGTATPQSFLNALAVYRDAPVIDRNCAANRKAAA